MNNLLKKRTNSAPEDGASSSASKTKTALDALLTEMGKGPSTGPAKDMPGAIYDRKFQTKGTPWFSPRYDEVPVENDPVIASLNLQTGMVGEGKDRHPRHLPPRDKNLRSETTEKELDAERRKDTEGYTHTSAMNTPPEPPAYVSTQQAAVETYEVSSLTSTNPNYDFYSDKSGRIARKIASNRLFKQYVTASNVKVDSDSLIINLSRDKVAFTEISPGDISEMEKHISSTLKVRAKFAHVILSSGFDGVALEFLLV